MDELLFAIQKKPVDGFTFRMLIGTAYSILDCLDVAADRARIGERNSNGGYTIYSKTQNIKLMKLYGDRKTGRKKTYDFEYFRFLRSFITAHPLETNHETTVSGFLPGKYGFCKFVDYIGDNHVHFNRPEGADYWVQVLEDGSNWTNVDFYINSKEIWEYVTDRFDQLVNTIHDVMKYRIEETIELLKETPIPTFPENPDLNYLDALIQSDWEHGGELHYELMQCKVALNSIVDFEWDDQYKDILIKAIWEYVHNLSESIQNMYESEEHDTSFHHLMKSIGCDQNQCSNLWEMLHEQYCFGADCENYQEHGLNNYQKYDTSPHIDCNERRTLYEEIKNHIENELSHSERIEIVTELYRRTSLSRPEIARSYFVVVLPQFVERYQLFDKLCSMESYELFMYIMACGLIDRK